MNMLSSLDGKASREENKIFMISLAKGCTTSDDDGVDGFSVFQIKRIRALGSDVDNILHEFLNACVTRSSSSRVVLEQHLCETFLLFGRESDRQLALGILH